MELEFEFEFKFDGVRYVVSSVSSTADRFPKYRQISNISHTKSQH